MSQKTPTAGDLLFGQEVRVYRPAVAKALSGANNVIQAILLEQIHYWLSRSANTHDGKKWVYKSFSKWGDELGLTEDQVRKALDKLRSQGLVISMNNPRNAWDRVLWWTIDYDKLAEFAATVLHVGSGPDASGLRPTSLRAQDHIEAGSGPDRCGLRPSAIPETTSKSTNEMTGREIHTKTTQFTVEIKDGRSGDLVSPEPLLNSHRKAELRKLKEERDRKKAERHSLTSSV